MSSFIVAFLILFLVFPNLNFAQNFLKPEDIPENYKIHENLIMEAQRAGLHLNSDRVNLSFKSTDGSKSLYITPVRTLLIDESQQPFIFLDSQIRRINVLNFLEHIIRPEINFQSSFWGIPTDRLPFLFILMNGSAGQSYFNDSNVIIFKYGDLATNLDDVVREELCHYIANTVTGKIPHYFHESVPNLVCSPRRRIALALENQQIAKSISGGRRSVAGFWIF